MQWKEGCSFLFQLFTAFHTNLSSHPTTECFEVISTEGIAMGSKRNCSVGFRSRIATNETVLEQVLEYKTPY